MRLAFMGAPAFALPTLDALLAAGHEIAAVYTQPDRPAGRGKKLTPTPVGAHAAALGVDVRKPASLKPAAAEADFVALRVDAAVVVAYGLILRQPVLEAPRLGCLNLHASLLPRWRGAAPIQRAILAGDALTGVCAMRMERGLDTGPVLLRAETPIGQDETTGALTERLAQLGAPLMVEALAGLDAGRLTAEPQPEAGATYAAKIDKAEARIDWTLPAAQLARLVRAMAPSPGAWTEAEGGRLKVLAARAVAGAGPPGAVLDDRLTVACGEGALRVDVAQRPGRGPQPTEALLRGAPIPPGLRLGAA